MEFEIDQSRAVAAVALASAVADKRSTSPILANVLIRADADGVTFLATDMMIGTAEAVAAKVTTPGAITVKAGHLYNVLRVLPAGVVTITAMDNSWIQIHAGRSEFKIMGLPEGDFPDLPETDATMVEIPSGSVIGLVDHTLFSVSTDEARVNLNGALFESDGTTATMVSTDGHRLTKYALPMAGPVLPRGVVIPRKGLAEVRKVLDRVGGICKIGISDSHLFVSAGALTLSVKLNLVTFPPWQQVVPKKTDRRVEASREELVGALRQAIVMAPEKTSTVRMSLTRGLLTLHADNPELGSIELSLEVDYSKSDLVAGFNAAYLLEALGTLEDDRVVLEFQGELDPVVVRPAGDSPIDFLAVVMPMRI